MRVLIVSPTIPPDTGGAETFAVELSRMLAARGHPITVLTQTADAHPIAGVEIVSLNSPPIPDRMSRLPSHAMAFLSVLNRYRALLQDRRIDTVCVARVDAKVAYLLMLQPILGFRLVTYLRGAEIRKLQRDSRRFRSILRWALRTSDAVVAVSQDLAQEASCFRPLIDVIPNGVDRAAVDAAPPAQWPRPMILYAGRLAAVKNVGTLIRAFARARFQVPEPDLVIAGEGPERAALAASVAENGLASRVHFLGVVSRNQLFSLMKCSVLLVLPSLAEGHPNVLLEALAAGTVPLASRVKGNRDVLPNDLDIWFEPHDELHLATLLSKYVNDGRARAELEKALASVPFADLDSQIDRHVQVLSGAERARV